MNRRTASKRLSVSIPSLPISASNTTKPFDRLSFSEEFHETVHPITVRVSLASGEVVAIPTTTGETVKNIAKFLEEHHGMPKDTVMLTYNDSLLLPCLSLADVPGLTTDPHPVIAAVCDEQ